MTFLQIVTCSTMLLTIITVLLFLMKVIFSLKAPKGEWKKNRRFNNGSYQINKQKVLMKHQEILIDKQENIRVSKEDLEIVNIVKPLGKWTKMVMMGNNLMKHFTHLVNREGNKGGFWELFVKAQSSTNSKYKGKGR